MPKALSLAGPAQVQPLSRWLCCCYASSLCPLFQCQGRPGLHRVTEPEGDMVVVSAVSWVVGPVPWPGQEQPAQL